MNVNNSRNGSRRAGYMLTILATVLMVVLAGCGGIGDVPDSVSDADEQSKATAQMEAAVALQERYSEDWMANDEIVGTAIGRSATGDLAIMVLAKSDLAKASALVPQQVDGVPVIVRVTGPLVSIESISAKTNPQILEDYRSTTVGATEATGRYDRPVPIGVSTGNIEDCSAGTIGVRVKRGDKVFALSNNHVYALENQATWGSYVLQPGRYDTDCAVDNADVFGILTAYIPIRFDGRLNLIDAAIARTTTENLGTGTPADGYGVPKSTVVPAQIDQAVQKYGRTTSLTFGTVTMLNAIVRVGYASGSATFIGQIIVEADKPFILPGDSGSLLVTQRVAEPVGLLFAGDETGTFAVANPIQRVLNFFGVEIDGE